MEGDEIKSEGELKIITCDKQIWVEFAGSSRSDIVCMFSE